MCGDQELWLTGVPASEPMVKVRQNTMPIYVAADVGAYDVLCEWDRPVVPRLIP